MKNLCIAHRGCSGKAPENTLAAMKLAVEQKEIDMIEFDVQMTRDGIPVVIHDYTLERTTNGTGFVGNYTLRELKKLDAGSWFHPDYTGETIPTLEEVIQLTKGQIGLNIELKRAGDWYPEIEEKVVSLIRKYNIEKHVSLISFNHQTVKTLSSLAPDIKTGLLIYGVPILIEEQLKETGAQILSMNYPYLTRPFIQPLLDREIEFIAWTIDDPEHMKQIAKLDERISINTNHPDRWLALVK